MIVNPIEATIQQVHVINPPKMVSKQNKNLVSNDTEFTIMANINFATEVSDARLSDADGIGLYRTEFECMVAERFLDEDEQFVRYKSVIPVYIRLLDLGRDKSVGDYNFSVGNLTKKESFGAQFLMNNPDVLKTQAKAIARASEYGPVSVSYPMISDLNQFISLKELFSEATSGKNSEHIKHGVMLELPSACMSAGLILRVADFGCIGTNDLISYLFGIKRDSHSDAVREAAEHPMLWKLIKGMAKSAQDQGKPLLFCGELAQEPKCIEKLIKLCINSISVTPKLIPQLKSEVSNLYCKNNLLIEKRAVKRELLVNK